MHVEENSPFLGRLSFDVDEEEVLSVPEAAEADATGVTPETSHAIADFPRSRCERGPFLGRLSFEVGSGELFDVPHMVKGNVLVGRSETSDTTVVVTRPPFGK